MAVIVISWDFFFLPSLSQKFVPLSPLSQGCRWLAAGHKIWSSSETRWMPQAALFNSEPFTPFPPSICPRKEHAFFMGDLLECPPPPPPPLNPPPPHTPALKKYLQISPCLHSAFAHMLSHAEHRCRWVSKLLRSLCVFVWLLRHGGAQICSFLAFSAHPAQVLGLFTLCGNFIVDFYDRRGTRLQHACYFFFYINPAAYFKNDESLLPLCLSFSLPPTPLRVFFSFSLSPSFLSLRQGNVTPSFSLSLCLSHTHTHTHTHTQIHAHATLVFSHINMRAWRRDKEALRKTERESFSK